MFARHAEMLVARAGGDDDGFSFNFFAVHNQRERTLGEIRGFHDAKTGFCAEAFGLLLHPRHQFIAIHAFGKAGKVFHDAGGGEQAAGLLAGEDERRELGAGGVKRGGPTGGTGTDDDNFFHKPRKVNFGG